MLPSNASKCTKMHHFGESSQERTRERDRVRKCPKMSDRGETSQQASANRWTSARSRLHYRLRAGSAGFDAGIGECGRRFPPIKSIWSCAIVKRCEAARSSTEAVRRLKTKP